MYSQIFTGVRFMADETKWLSISELATRAGVARQVLGRRVKKFAAAGRLETRREGAKLLVDETAFERLVAAAHDPAQDLRNRRKRRGRKPEADGEELETYDEATRREKTAKAQLAEMQVAQKRGELVRATDLESAAARVGTSISQRVAELKSKSGKLFAAGVNGGEEGIHVALVEEVDRIIRAVRGGHAGARY